MPTRTRTLARTVAKRMNAGAIWLFTLVGSQECETSLGSTHIYSLRIVGEEDRVKRDIGSFDRCGEDSFLGLRKKILGRE